MVGNTGITVCIKQEGDPDEKVDGNTCMTVCVKPEGDPDEKLVGNTCMTDILWHRRLWRSGFNVHGRSFYSV